MIGDVRIERATPDDLNPVLALLALHDLPPDALEEHLATMLVARRGGDVVGSAALEVYADGTLLRSVAVAPDVQGQGVGRMLTKAALSLAEANRTPNEACCEPPQIPSIKAQSLYQLRRRDLADATGTRKTPGHIFAALGPLGCQPDSLLMSAEDKICFEDPVAAT